MRKAPKKVAAASGTDDVKVWCAYSEMVEIDALKPNPRNPNTHPQRQVELLAKNIAHFGWRHPITVSRRSGLIVSGHGRLQAAKLLRLTCAPVDYQQFDSDADEIAVLVADNRLAELAAIDLNELEKIAESWRAENFDTLLAGFEPADLDSMLNPDATAPETDPGEDGDLEKGNISVNVGKYRYHVSPEEFNAWNDRLRQEIGFEKEKIMAHIRGRLGL